MAWYSQLAAIAPNAATGSATSSLGYYIDVAFNYSFPYKGPSLEELTRGFLVSVMGYSDLIGGSRLYGEDISTINKHTVEYTRRSLGTTQLSQQYMRKRCNPHEKALRSNLYWPSIQETNFLLNRGEISEELAEFIINKQTTRNPALTQSWLNSRYEIPGPSDLIRFAVRDCFTPGIVQEYGYHKERPTEILEWMNKQGYGQDIGIPIPDGGTDQDGMLVHGNATWFDLYWWSHWELPSLTQGYDMFHRLYADSRYGVSPDVRNNQTFVGQDLEKLQKAQDIPSYWRQRLQAISYLPYTRTDVQRMYKLGVLNEADVYHAYRAIGYDDERANNLKNFTKVLKEKDLGIDPGKSAVKTICEYYTIGIIPREDATQLYLQQGYTLPIATRILDKCDMDFRLKEIKETLGLLREAYYLGEFNDDQLRDQFRNLGLEEDRWLYYLRQWSTRRNIKKKHLSVKILMQFYVDGSITEQEFQGRLQNLNYTIEEITYILRNTNRQRAKRWYETVAKELKQRIRSYEKLARDRAKQLNQRRKELSQLQKEQQNKYEIFVRRLLSASTDKNLVEWMKMDLISLKDVYYRLMLRGWGKRDIERWIKAKIGEISEEKLNATEKEASEMEQQDRDRELSSDTNT